MSDSDLDNIVVEVARRDADNDEFEDGVDANSGYGTLQTIRVVGPKLSAVAVVPLSRIPTLLASGVESAGEDASVHAGTPALMKGNDLKTNMGNERTFFKWLFTALHVGTSGTWILKFFSAPGPLELWLVLGAWVVAFAIVGYGLAGFYRRRKAIQTGSFEDEAVGPLAIVLLTFSCTFTMGGIILYSMFTLEHIE
ncbi:hypothetical protein FVE85_4118 [Porphyridium purpureum]|uniref:DUF202 domain-containing protein n=1 Tax=Porphyridium purpureum TaxID=35688 RepID=A0A5J4YTP5_PORPP|nr:hypothetical protein FVE85_4118 [Porphyridium purpureum]|eukprot:POR3504..scf229_5